MAGLGFHTGYLIRQTLRVHCARGRFDEDLGTMLAVAVDHTRGVCVCVCVFLIFIHNGLLPRGKKTSFFSLALVCTPCAQCRRHRRRAVRTRAPVGLSSIPRLVVAQSRRRPRPHPEFLARFAAAPRRKILVGLFPATSRPRPIVALRAHRTRSTTEHATTTTTTTTITTTLYGYYGRRRRRYYHHYYPPP